MWILSIFKCILRSCFIQNDFKSYLVGDFEIDDKLQDFYGLWVFFTHHSHNSYVAYHMSYVTYHISHIICHISYVTYHMSHIICNISYVIYVISVILTYTIKDMPFHYQTKFLSSGYLKATVVMNILYKRYVMAKYNFALQVITM